MIPSISVIIPTFNRRRTVGRAVQSVLDQSFSDFELIVVDDRSSDGTVSLLRERFHDHRMRILGLEHHRGVSAARNEGVKAARGDWIAFLDSDDEWHSDKLARQWHYHREHPDFRIGQTREIWVRHGRRVNSPRSHQKFEGDLFAASLQRCMITPSSVLLHRRLFLEVGGFNEALPACEDYDLWLRITARYHVGLVDEYLLTRYGGHEDQLSATVPVLDRFRIRSLIGLLETVTLKPDQAAAARRILARKARIVASGARKRGRHAAADSYETIAQQYGAK